MEILNSCTVSSEETIVAPETEGEALRSIQTGFKSRGASYHLIRNLEGMKIDLSTLKELACRKRKNWSLLNQST